LRLLLDEMISPRTARELREAGHDVQAIKRDRPELSGKSDRELVRCMATERRTIVTNDVDDFTMIDEQLLAAGQEHHGMIFTDDATMPRTKDAIPQWVKTLTELLTEHPGDDSLRNRIHHLR
jgi:predicted nuclease of predicted toxin-antitoxin system